MCYQTTLPRTNDRTYPRDSHSLRGGLAATLAVTLMCIGVLCSLLPAMASPAWIELGPSRPPDVTGQINATGRIDAITVDPSDASHQAIWVGSPGGGPWKTIDGGQTWKPMGHDSLPTLAVSEIVVDTADPDTIYLATGDGDNETGIPVSSVGVWKSTDGGTTWQPTGLVWEQSERTRIGKLLAHPDPARSGTLIAATSKGLFKTVDGGNNWYRPNDGAKGCTVPLEVPAGHRNGFRDIEVVDAGSGLDPIWFATLAGATDRSTDVAGQYNIHYQGGIFRSLDGGECWHRVETGLPQANDPANDEIGRIEIAPAPSQPGTLYAIYIEDDPGRRYFESNLYNVYSTTNYGQSWNEVRTAGLSAPGGNWHLAAAVSPVNANALFVGSLFLYQGSISGSTTTWSRVSTTAHVDYHALEFFPGSADFLAGTDGGLYELKLAASTPGSFSFNTNDLSRGLGVHQLHAVCGSPSDRSLIYSGAQDNGINKYLSGVWQVEEINNDGGQCVVGLDSSGQDVPYLLELTGRFLSNGDITLPMPISGDAGVRYSIALDPGNSSIVYLGTRNGVYKSVDGATTAGGWTHGTGMRSGEHVSSIAVAPSDPRIIYAYGQTDTPRLYRSNDSGGSWTHLVGAPTPCAGTRDDDATRWITGIAVHPSHPNVLWVVNGGLKRGEKVFKSEDFGNTWQNVSGNASIPACAPVPECGPAEGCLANLPVGAIAANPSTPYRIFVGTEDGVYRSSGNGNWKRYGDGFPNVSVTGLEHHEPTGCLRAATFGRGLWETCPELPTGTSPGYLSGGSYYSGSIPLLWLEPSGSEPVASYSVWRKTGADLDFAPLALGLEQLYYRDETAQDGVAYAYKVQAHYSAADPGTALAIAQAGPAFAGQPENRRLVRSTRAPFVFIDGRIESYEWGNAATIPLTLDCEGDPCPEPVEVRLMNDDEAIYIAYIDSNVTSLDDAIYRVQVGLDWVGDRAWQAALPDRDELYELKGYADGTIEGTEYIMDGKWPDGQIALSIPLFWLSTGNDPEYGFRIQDGVAYHEIRIPIVGGLQSHRARLASQGRRAMGLLLNAQAGKPMGDGTNYKLTGLWPFGARTLSPLITNGVWSELAEAPPAFGDLILTERCNIDTDMDGICDNNDNCPTVANMDQADADGDGTGDVCDVCWDVPAGSNADTGRPGCPADTTNPVCEIGRVYNGPPVTVELRTQDPYPESGLDSILVLMDNDVNVIIPTFMAGTNAEVLVAAENLSTSRLSQVKLQPFDTAGNSTVCGAIMLKTVIEKGRPLTETVTGVSNGTEITVINGNPGVKTISILVNSTKFDVTGLGDEQVRVIDVSSGLKEGENTFAVSAAGKPGTEAIVTIPIH